MTIVERIPVCALSMLAVLLVLLVLEAEAEEELAEVLAALESILCQS